ncbi:ribose 5-phosphate isomerase A [Sphingobacterium sp.]|uniref:ribose 5-phosphate isomerase A n=1 Tax=Sphingobacterium sp. TaxID=341027 RepID=UPI002FDEDDB7
MINLKQEAAKAALQLLKPDQLIGLGVGSTIAYFIELIASSISFKSSLKFISPSFETKMWLKENGLVCIDGSTQATLDYYFDSCDQLDMHLNAFKSGGGVHTGEKIMANMANQFILLADGPKMVEKLTTKYPLCVEIIPEAWLSVRKELRSSYSTMISEIVLRKSEQKAGPLLSERGNFLADIYFSKLPDIHELNKQIKHITGVVEHSLFYQLCSVCLLATADGVIHLTANRAEK